MMMRAISRKNRNRALLFAAFLIFLSLLWWQLYGPGTSPDAGIDADSSSETDSRSPRTRESPIAAGTLTSTEDENGNRFDAVVVDLNKTDLRLFLYDDDHLPIGSFKRLSDTLAQKGLSLVFAMNAGIFGKDNLPLGLHVENGREIRPLNIRVDESAVPGNFYLRPNGVFAVRENKAFIDETTDFKQTVGRAGDLRLATQSGPLLVIDGQINPRFQSGSHNKTLRNGVGVIGSSSVVFIISNRAVNLYDFAKVFKDEFGCQNALYLDGAISKMYIPEAGVKPDESIFAGLLAVTVKSE